jgi:hypothetical protein
MLKWKCFPQGVRPSGCVLSLGLQNPIRSLPHCFSIKKMLIPRSISPIATLFHRVHVSSADDSTAPLTFLARGMLATGRPWAAQSPRTIASTLGTASCPPCHREPCNSSPVSAQPLIGAVQPPAHWHPPLRTTPRHAGVELRVDEPPFVQAASR